MVDASPFLNILPAHAGDALPMVLSPPLLDPYLQLRSRWEWKLFCDMVSTSDIEPLIKTQWITYLHRCELAYPATPYRLLPAPQLPFVGALCYPKDN